METDTTLATRLSDAIRARLAGKGRSQRWLAIQLGIDPPNLHRMLNGVTVMKVDTLRRIADLLDTDVDVLLGRRPAAALSLPNCGWIPGGKPGDPAADDGVTDLGDMFQGGTFTLVVRGESMVGAGLYDNDRVILRKADAANNGDIVAAVVNGERTLKLMGTDDEGRPALLSFNDEFPPIVLGDDDEVKVEGVVVGGAWSMQERRWKPKPVRKRQPFPDKRKK